MTSSVGSRRRPRALLPPALEASTGFLLSKAAETLRRKFEARLAAHGLTARHVGVLSTISGNSSLKQRDLCALLRIDRTTMVALIDSLESLGLAARRGVAGDRRSFRIEPTAKGRLVAERALADAARVEAECLRALGRRDRENLRHALQTILESTAYDAAD
jgi:DNA-binding MarR family transcriptional regulator